MHVGRADALSWPIVTVVSTVKVKMRTTTHRNRVTVGDNRLRKSADGTSATAI